MAGRSDELDAGVGLAGADVTSVERPPAGEAASHLGNGSGGSAGDDRPGGRTMALATRRQAEEWFGEHGFPLFYQPMERGAVRRGVVLYFFFLAVEAIALGVNHEYSLAHNMVAALCSLLLVFGALLLADYVPKPLFRIYVWALCVLVPAAPALIFGTQWVLFVAAVCANVALRLYVAAHVAGIRLYPFFALATGETLRQIPHLVSVVVRALPFLLVGVLLLFFTGEVWQMAAQLHGTFLVVVPALFVIVAIVTQIGQVVHLAMEYGKSSNGVRREPPEEPTEEWTRMDDLVSALENLAVPPGRRKNPPADARIVANLSFLLFVVENVQILAVSLAFGLFFLVFGLLAIPDAIQSAYLGGQELHTVPHVPSFTFWGRQVRLSHELLNVVIFMTVFSYLSFVFHAATLSNDYVRTFLGHIDQRIRDALVVRRSYLAVCWGPRREKSGSRCQLTFELPSGIKAGTAELVGRCDSAEAGEEHDMAQPEGRFFKSLTHPTGTRFQYHYRIDKDVFLKDWAVDEYVVDQSGIEESVVKFSTESLLRFPRRSRSTSQEDAARGV